MFRKPRGGSTCIAAPCSASWRNARHGSFQLSSTRHARARPTAVRFKSKRHVCKLLRRRMFLSIPFAPDSNNPQRIMMAPDQISPFIRWRRFSARRMRFCQGRPIEDGSPEAVAKPSLTKAIRSPCSPPRDERRSLNRMTSLPSAPVDGRDNPRIKSGDAHDAERVASPKLDRRGLDPCVQKRCCPSASVGRVRSNFPAEALGCAGRARA